MDTRRNIAVTLAYDGRAYHGWQIQKNAVTVQETFQAALRRVIGNDEDIKGCSRTDTGVHANCFVLNFHTDSTISTERLTAALNHYLPVDIAVKECEEVPSDFHARYSCEGKEYIYRVYTGKNRDPFLNGLVYHYPYKLDIELMRENSKAYIGVHDFTSFCASGSSAEDKVRNVFDFTIEESGESVVFTVSADGFLYNMVRIMVGTLFNISEGKIENGVLDDIIERRNRAAAGVTAPPHGLYLNRVFYKPQSTEKPPF